MSLDTFLLYLAACLQGLLVQLTNPKNLMFVLAFCLSSSMPHARCCRSWRRMALAP